MKILHIWDEAGVACTFSKFQNINGNYSRVILPERQDKFGIYKFYNTYVDMVKEDNLLEKCYFDAQKADVIHIHSKAKYVLELRKRLGSSKKIFLHYHGTDIRGLQNQDLDGKSFLSDLTIMGLRIARRARDTLFSVKKMHSDAQRLANQVFVSTPDLLDFVNTATYIPNPVDTDHFCRDENFVPNNKAFTIRTETSGMISAMNYCKSGNFDFDIEVYDRTSKPISFDKMPNFLKNYGIYVDVRHVNGKILTNLSKTALEALSCGLRVVNFKLKFIEGLPAEHDPKNAIAKLDSFYNMQTN